MIVKLEVRYLFSYFIVTVDQKMMEWGMTKEREEWQAFIEEVLGSNIPLQSFKVSKNVVT